MKKIIIFLIIFLFFIFVFLSTLKIKIYKRYNSQGVITISFLYFFKFNIDIGKSLNIYINKFSFKDKITIFINNSKFFSKYQYLTKKIINHLKVTKSTLIIHYNSTNENLLPVIGFSNWFFIINYRYLMNTYFKTVSKEYYQIYLYNPHNSGIDLDLEFKITLGLLLKIIIFNLSDIISLYKGQRRNVNGKNSTC